MATLTAHLPLRLACSIALGLAIGDSSGSPLRIGPRKRWQHGGGQHVGHAIAGDRARDEVHGNRELVERQPAIPVEVGQPPDASELCLGQAGLRSTHAHATAHK